MNSSSHSSGSLILNCQDHASVQSSDTVNVDVHVIIAGVLLII